MAATAPIATSHRASNRLASNHFEGIRIDPLRFPTDPGANNAPEAFHASNNQASHRILPPQSLTGSLRRAAGH
jgi:hypothetical protein